jgi:hypothetical protein
MTLKDGTTTTSGKLTLIRRGGCWPGPMTKTRPRCSMWMRVAAGAWPMALLMPARQWIGRIGQAGLANLIRFSAGI